MGAEGMYGNLEWSGAIATHESDLINHAIQLYTEENQWKTAQKKGYEIIEKRFKTSLFAADFMNKVYYLQENLNTHRNKNFLGQIVQHQSLQSTKYMSKWIESKNK